MKNLVIFILFFIVIFLDIIDWTWSKISLCAFVLSLVYIIECITIFIIFKWILQWKITKPIKLIILSVWLLLSIFFIYYVQSRMKFVTSIKFISPFYLLFYTSIYYFGTILKLFKVKI